MFEYVIGHRRLSHVIRNRFRSVDSPLEAEEPIVLETARRGRGTIIFVPELCGARLSFLSSALDAAFSISQALATRQLRVSFVCPCQHMNKWWLVLVVWFRSILNA